MRLVLADLLRSGIVVVDESGLALALVFAFFAVVLPVVELLRFFAGIVTGGSEVMSGRWRIEDVDVDDRRVGRMTRVPRS